MWTLGTHFAMWLVKRRTTRQTKTKRGLTWECGVLCGVLPGGGKKEQQSGRIGQIGHRAIKQDMRRMKQRMRPNVASGSKPRLRPKLQGCGWPTMGRRGRRGGRRASGEGRRSTYTDDDGNIHETEVRVRMVRMEENVYFSYCFGILLTLLTPLVLMYLTLLTL